MERELYITRDNDVETFYSGEQIACDLNLFEIKPVWLPKRKMWTIRNSDDRMFMIDASLFSEIKPGECKKVKITIEFIDE